MAILKPYYSCGREPRCERKAFPRVPPTLTLSSPISPTPAHRHIPGRASPRMPKRGSALSSVAPTKRTKGVGNELAYVCRWARCTDVDGLDHKKIQEVEWPSGKAKWNEIHACIKEELESVLSDEHATSGAYRSRASALQARDELMKQKIEEAKQAVRQAYDLSPAQWQKLLKSDWVCEYSDTKTFGVKYKRPGEPTPHQDLAWRWANRPPTTGAPAAAFTFHDAQHNLNDPLQAHYELAWGSLEGCKVCKVEADDMIECCETILTRIRCWVELKG